MLFIYKSDMIRAGFQIDESKRFLRCQRAQALVSFTFLYDGQEGLEPSGKVLVTLLLHQRPIYLVPC